MSDAKEDRQVTVVGLPRVYLDADNYEDAILLMKGRLAELMIMVAL